MAAPIHPPVITRYPASGRLRHVSAAPAPTPLVDSVAPFFALAVSSPGPNHAPHADQPYLRVIPGGREATLRRRQPAAVYRRRRLAAGFAVMVLTALICGAAVIAIRALSNGAPLDADARAGVAASSTSVSSVSVQSPDPAEATTITVRPGDTLWSIAERLAPDADVRPVVDELARRHGGASLEVGERLDVVGIVEG